MNRLSAAVELSRSRGRLEAIREIEKEMQRDRDRALVAAAKVLSIDEIADILDVSKGAATGRLYNARQRLDVEGPGKGFDAGPRRTYRPDARTNP